ncbi:hypothetical protein Trydic_g19249 [Trypoxylus dichotomus]
MRGVELNEPCFVKQEIRILGAEIVLIDNNARPRDLSASYDWKQLGLLPYSPDLAPRDHHLFWQLKKHIADQRYVKIAILDLLTNWAADFYIDGIRGTLKRYILI